MICWTGRFKPPGPFASNEMLYLLKKIQSEIQEQGFPECLCVPSLLSEVPHELSCSAKE